MTKCILIKICINSFSISTKTLIFFYYSRVLRPLHVACTINVEEEEEEEEEEEFIHLVIGQRRSRPSSTDLTKHVKYYLH